MKKILWIALFIMLPLAAYARIEDVRTRLHEGNDGFVTIGFFDQQHRPTAPGEVCYYIHDEKTKTKQFEQCVTSVDKIHQFTFNASGTAIQDEASSEESKLFTAIWESCAGSSCFNQQKVWRFYVINNPTVTVQYVGGVWKAVAN